MRNTQLSEIETQLELDTWLTQHITAISPIIHPRGFSSEQHQRQETRRVVAHLRCNRGVASEERQSRNRPPARPIGRAHHGQYRARHHAEPFERQLEGSRLRATK